MSLRSTIRRLARPIARPRIGRPRRRADGRRLRLEPLEDRRLLASWTVDTDLDLSDPADDFLSLREAVDDIVELQVMGDPTFLVAFRTNPDLLDEMAQIAPYLGEEQMDFYRECEAIFAGMLAASTE